MRRNCARRHGHCNQLSHAHLGQHKRNHRIVRSAIRLCACPYEKRASAHMIAPAYSMDAAPMVYEASLQASGTRPAAVDHSFVRTTDSSRVQMRPVKLADSSTSTTASFNSGEGASQYMAAISSTAIGLEKFPNSGSRSSKSISNAGSRNPESRARLARWAYAIGWIFLAIALFCLAQSFSVIPSAQQRRWRAVARAHS